MLGRAVLIEGLAVPIVRSDPHLFQARNHSYDRTWPRHLRTTYVTAKNTSAFSGSIRTVNSVMVQREHEDSFATLDMLEINLYHGRAELIKIGVAPSFLVRGDKVDVVRFRARAGRHDRPGGAAEREPCIIVTVTSIPSGIS